AFTLVESLEESEYISPYKPINEPITHPLSISDNIDYMSSVEYQPDDGNSSPSNAIMEMISQDEILDSLEIEGVEVIRLPKEMNTSGYRSRPFVSPSELAKSGVSGYTPEHIVGLSKDKRIPPNKQIHHIVIHGRVFLDGLGVEQLMEHEE